MMYSERGGENVNAFSTSALTSASVSLRPSLFSLHWTPTILSGWSSRRPVRSTPCCSCPRRPCSCTERSPRTQRHKISLQRSKACSSLGLGICVAVYSDMAIGLRVAERRLRNITLAWEVGGEEAGAVGDIAERCAVRRGHPRS